MLSDRPYMRDNDYDAPRTSLLTWILCAVVVGFVFQVIFSTALPFPGFERATAFTVENITRGWAWTLLSYGFLHTGVLHVLFNCLGLYFLGRDLLPTLGERRLLWVALGALLCGAGLWLLVHASQGGVLMGITPVVSALLMIFACLNPNREMTFLFFFIPITIKPKYLVMILGGLDVLGMVGGEIYHSRFTFGYAHSASLGGMLAGLAYFRLIHLREWRNPDRQPALALPTWLARTAEEPAPKQDPAPAPAALSASAAKESLKAEVDRILDKINSHGFGSLTAKEKRLLDDARDQLSRR